MNIKRHNTTKSFSDLVCRIQHDLEVSTKQAIFVDSSINDTIRTCIVLGNHRAALKVKTEFKVCELQFAISLRVCYCRIITLFMCSYSYLPAVFFMLCLRFLRKDGIGLKFLLWLPQEIGLHWKRSRRRKDRQSVNVRLLE